MRTTTFGQLATEGALQFGDGYRTRRDELASTGFTIIRVADVADGRVSLAGTDHVSEDRRRQIGVKRAEPGDVLLTTKGTVGRVAVMPPAAGDFVYSPQLCWFRVAPRGPLDAGYLRYWLQSGDFRRQADTVKGNTDMAPYISLTDLRSASIVLRPLDEQRAIAEVLGALDDKIAANDRLVATADNLLAAHFERATTEGEDVPLSSLARFVNGKAFTKGASGTGRVVIRIAELNSGIGASTVYNDIEVADDHVARPGDLLFAWSGSLTVKRWFRPEAIINQHIFKVMPTTAPMWVVKGALDRKLVDFRAIAADKATTMGHIQRRHLDEPVRVPATETISALHAAMTGLWDRTLSAEVESLRLAELRDTLLPALMSGRLTVKDAESTVSEVV